ncbi:MAG: hypothetical protein V4597_11715 [Pseudomonadota bacterium]
MDKMKCSPDACPQVGDVLVCEYCGCTILFVKKCACSDEECTSFACCGKAMHPAN